MLRGAGQPQVIGMALGVVEDTCSPDEQSALQPREVAAPLANGVGKASRLQPQPQQEPLTLVQLLVAIGVTASRSRSSSGVEQRIRKAPPVKIPR